MATRARTAAVLLTCLAAVAGGTGLLVTHATTPGHRGTPPDQLPAELLTRLAAPPATPLLLLAAHPMCPCLPATLERWHALLASTAAGNTLTLRVLVLTPSAPPPAWDAAAAAALRRELPAATTIDDRDGEIAQRLGLHTSGHLLLYGSDGTLRFDGGVTAGRGHRGDNPAARALARALAGAGTRTTSPRETPDVFGCPLGTDSAAHGSDCCSPQSGDPCPRGG